jgi:hypothetical protein
MLGTLCEQVVGTAYLNTHDEVGEQGVGVARETWATILEDVG